MTVTATILFGVPLFVFAIFAALPTWRAYLTGGAVLAVILILITGLLALLDTPPSLQRLGSIPLWGALIAAIIPFPAQAWRGHRLRTGREPHYHYVLAPTLALALLGLFQVLA